MDTTTQDIKKTSQQLIPPAQLFVGNDGATCAHACTYLKQILCPQKGCNACITCTQIDQRQHHSLFWLQPEKQYTRELLQPIFHTISFALHETQQFFFVIQHAERLTPACANSLLKSLEEPPPGYHFLLLADCADQLLPTIRSRCIAKTIHSKTVHVKYEELFALFTSTTFCDPALFLKKLELAKISEQESRTLLDQLLDYWIAQYKSALKSDDKNQVTAALRVVTIFNQALAHPPMPGSSKLLWKDLFLHIKTT